MKTLKTITKEQAIKAGNDGQNQDIKSRFVEREVYCNVNSLVEYCLKHGYEDSESPVNLDEIENYYSMDVDNAIEAAIDYFGSTNDPSELIDYANDPDTYNRRVKTKGDFEVFLKSLDEDELKQLCDDFSIGYETEPQEIFEWWAVSSYLYDQLKANGYPVVDTGSCKVWGRTTTGQAILLDGVITRICADMEILEGQANSWAKK